jgi:hypothetical protein
MVRCVAVKPFRVEKPSRRGIPQVVSPPTASPDTTNSSRVVPYGRLQAENGVDWTVRQGSNVVSGTETRLLLGVARCTEVLADVPMCFYSLNGRASSGFSDLVVSIKRELPVPFGFHSSHGYDPYIQFPWSRRLSDDGRSMGCSPSPGLLASTQSIRRSSRHCRLSGISGRRATYLLSTWANIRITRGPPRSTTPATPGE